jgi:hypothetical protein
VFGEQDLPGSIARATKLAASYAALSDVPVVPMFEIIATTASSEPGADRTLLHSVLHPGWACTDAPGGRP